MKLTIIGASGHGKVAADIAKRCGYDEILFLDDNDSVKKCCGYDVIGNTSLISETNNDIFVAIGDAKIRRRFMEKFRDKRIVSLIHPNAVVAESVEIGRGTIVMAGAVINPDTKLGQGCIVNTSSSIDHDCIIGDYVHISVGAHICGTVDVGNDTFIGAGATVINNIKICNDCIIGAGAAVTRNISVKCTAVGVPAKMIKVL